MRIVTHCSWFSIWCKKTKKIKKNFNKFIVTTAEIRIYSEKVEQFCDFKIPKTIFTCLFPL
jgi:hypothetical protein